MLIKWGMELDAGDLEGLIEDGYRRAGVDDPDAVLLPAKLIRARFGPDAIVAIPNLRTRAQVSRVDGSLIFAVRASLSLTERRFCLGHEYAHIVCEDNGYDGNDLEQVCDFIGAGIQTRRKPFLKRVRALGNDFRQLSLEFGTTETLVALRVGETTGRPLAMVTPKSIRVRGAPWEWGSPEDVRRMAKQGNPGVVCATLTDGHDRTAVIPDCA